MLTPKKHNNNNKLIIIRLPNKAAELREEDRRGRVRPRLRWEDCVETDVMKAGEEEDWKKNTGDRGGWKKLSDEVVKKLRAAPYWKRENNIKRLFLPAYDPSSPSLLTSQSRRCEDANCLQLTLLPRISVAKTQHNTRAASSPRRQRAPRDKEVRAIVARSHGRRRSGIGSAQNRNFLK